MTAPPDWLDQARRLLDAAVRSHDARAAAEDGATSRADCAWCPLCTAAAMARGERPEVATALADVLTAAATALRTFAESAPRTEPDVPAGADGPEGKPPPAVQRIDIA